MLFSSSDVKAGAELAVTGPYQAAGAPPKGRNNRARTEAGWGRGKKNPAVRITVRSSGRNFILPLSQGGAGFSRPRLPWSDRRHKTIVCPTNLLLSVLLPLLALLARCFLGDLLDSLLGRRLLSGLLRSSLL